MSESGDILAERRAKLGRLREAGIDPYPHSYEDAEQIASVRETHGFGPVGVEDSARGLEPGTETGRRHRVAGRVIARRGHGKAAFIDLRDGSGQIQIHARADLLGEEEFGLLDNLDLGDFLGIEGEAFATRRGELSLAVESWRFLSKSLRPPPDKFHGLEDVETRYRRRELDLIANAESRRIFLIRAQVVRAVRRYLDEHDFVEVETPVLQPLYGGALARPFTTHHNALGRDFYLRIATELYLKRCVVGGIDRVYELGKDFRNEGISPKHNPEFTMVEWYEAYADYHKTAADLEAMVRGVATEVLGTTILPDPRRRTADESAAEPQQDGGDGAEEIDVGAPWRRITLRDAILAESGIDIDLHPDRDSLAAVMGVKPEAGEGWGKLVDTLFSKRVEPKLIQPTFIVDYPVELSPFAKAHRDKPGVVERWEAFLGGVEISNSFSELNDPDEQRRRFEQQAAEIAAGDEEAQPYDETFIAALEQGMPPTGGVGLGIDRLVMLLTGARNLREVILFPAMRD